MTDHYISDGGGGGGRESKNKNHARETERKKTRAPKNVQRLFNRENYKFFVYKLA